MKYGPFMAALRQNEPKHVYLLAGEEPFFIEKAERNLLRALCPDEASRVETVIHLDREPPLPELLELLETVPFLAEKQVFLIRDTKLFRETRSKTAATEKETKGNGKSQKGRAEVLQERLLAVLSDLPPSNYVIFLQNGKADKRRKLYKAVERVGAVLEADALPPWEIDGWLRDKLMELGRDMEREAKAFFLDVVRLMNPVSLTFLDRELSKLALFTDKKRFTREDLAQAFSDVPEVSAFGLTDAVDARDTRRAVYLLERQITGGAFLPMLAAGLARHVRQLWQARWHMARGVSAKALATPLKVHPYVATRLATAAPTYEMALLRRVFLALCDADYRLKVGQAGPAALEAAVLALVTRPAPSRPFQTPRAK